MKRIIATVFLAGFASAAFTQDTTRHARELVVGNGERCPWGFTEFVPAYTYEDGRLVQTGKVCETLYRN